MATVVLDAKNREELRSAKALRNEGFIPGVVYGGDMAPESICIAKEVINRYVYKSNFFSTVFEINGIGKKGQKYIAKEAQFHPVTDNVLHVDFMRVNKGNPVKLQVPLVFKNRELAPGLKLGGVLNVLTRKVTVVCEPDCIPEQIEVDLTGFEFHHVVHAFGLKLPEGVALPSKKENYTIATIIAPSSLRREEAKAAADTTTEATAEAPATEAAK